MIDKFIHTTILILFSFLIIGCQKVDEVVIYTSHDRNISEPILKDFENKTGIKVRAIYDTEANKTTGIVNRLIAEKKNPRADVFWNNEYVRTLHLQEFNILAATNSAELFKSIFSKDTGKMPFNGFAARARVFIINTKKVKQDGPRTLEDLVNKKWYQQVAFANPHFGTTGTHFSALLSQWGENKFKRWIFALKQNKAVMLPGNAQVRDQVVQGHFKVGLTDSDDVNSAILSKKNINMIVPGQLDNGNGVFIMPNTVSLVRGGPNTKEGKILLNFLLQAETEIALAKSRSAQIPILNLISLPSNVLDVRKLKLMKVNPIRVSKNYQKMLSIFTSIWNR